MLHIEEPKDYFKGIGQTALPTPTSILLFTRSTKQKLQQEALLNRSHHRFVLAINYQTRGQVHVDNLVHRFTPGQALLILPYQFHHFSHLTSPELRWLFCTFELDYAAFLEPMRDRVIDTGTQSGEALDVLTREWAEGVKSGWQEELQEARLQAALMRLLLALKQDVKSSSPDLPPDSTASLLRTINRLLSEWRGRPIVVADVAEALDVSESSLRARFKTVAGVPLGSYLQNYRLSRAMALLRTSTRPIAEVAEEAAFGSPQAFSRIFKKKVGQSPRLYRAHRTPD